MPGLAGQVLRQAAATMRPAPPLRLGAGAGGSVGASGAVSWPAATRRTAAIGWDRSVRRAAHTGGAAAGGCRCRNASLSRSTLCSEASSSRTMRLSVAGSSGRCSACASGQASGSGVREAHTYKTYDGPLNVHEKDDKKAGGRGRPPAQPAQPLSRSPAGGNAGRVGPWTSRCRPAAWPTRRHAASRWPGPRPWPASERSPLPGACRR